MAYKKLDIVDLAFQGRNLGGLGSLAFAAELEGRTEDERAAIGRFRGIFRSG